MKVKKDEVLYLNTNVKIKILIILIVVFASLAGAPQVFADDLIYSQTVADTPKYCAGNGSGACFSPQGFDFIAVGTETLGTVVLKLEALGDPVEMQVYLQSDGHGHGEKFSASVMVSGLHDYHFVFPEPLPNLGVGTENIILNVSPRVASSTVIAYADSSSDYYTYVYGDQVFDNTLTRIISVEPVNGASVATGTPITIGVTGYVNEADFDDDLFVKQTISLDSAPLLGNYWGGTGDLVQTYSNIEQFQYEITASGPFSFSTTTTFDQIGERNLVSSLGKEGFNIFGFNFGGSSLVSTSTKFLVATTSIGDNIDNSIEDDLATYADYASSTLNTLSDSCNPLGSGFNVTICIYRIIVPDNATLENSINLLYTNVLSRAPLGYVSRFVALASDNTGGGTLPTISYDFSTTSPLYQAGLTDIYFDPLGPLASSSNILYTKSDQVVPKTVWEIVGPLVDIFVYITLFFMILSQLVNIDISSSRDEDLRGTRYERSVHLNNVGIGRSYSRYVPKMMRKKKK